MNISDNIRYIGCDDTTLDLFESQYPVPEGVSYNSYVILDEKIAVMDTVDRRKGDEWLANLEKVLDGKKPDYLIVQHLEPDHSANIKALADKYPEMELVGSAKTKAMLPQFYEEDLSGRMTAVKEGDTLSLGSHTLNFVMAPMVHWPEVMVTYESSEKVLFSADGFGTFGAICNNVPWEQEASHYYLNIVGKYGASVQALLKKAAGLDIAVIAPLHGPVLKDNLGFYIDKYNTWSTYTPEIEGIFMPYASIHGNTAEAVLKFAEELKAAGANVLPMDLCREDVSEATEKAMQYSKMIVAACSYDAMLFPPMEDFLYHLECKTYQNRKVGIIENGSWAPSAGKRMREHLEKLKNVEIVEPMITIKTTRKAADQPQWDALKEAMIQ